MRTIDPGTILADEAPFGVSELAALASTVRVKAAKTACSVTVPIVGVECFMPKVVVSVSLDTGSSYRPRAER
jgi:hypothetical protein